MDEQESFIAKYPKIVFQSAHIASSSENLGYVAKLLGRYPNFNVDNSARLGEMGRQPSASRDFLIKYQDRVLHGIDGIGYPFELELERIYFRFYETCDEYFDYGLAKIPDQGRWRIYGINLPDSVLKKIYLQNAERIWGKQPKPVI